MRPLFLSEIGNISMHSSFIKKNEHLYMMEYAVFLTATMIFLLNDRNTDLLCIFHHLSSLTRNVPNYDKQ